MNAADLLQQARAHRAWSGGYLGGSDGFAEPDLAAATVHELAEGGTPALREHGIELVGAPGSNCRICIGVPASRYNLRVNLHGFDDTLIILGPTTQLHGQINVEGRDHLLLFAGSVHNNQINATFRSHHAAILMGRDGSANDVDLLAEERSLQIGDDALISYGVHVFTSDSHRIIDLSGPQPRAVHDPADIVIGPHVWLGANCVVEKGVTIGRGSIIATAAVVSKDIPERSLAGGVPAAVLRDRVTWSREMFPDAAAIERAARASAAPVSRQNS